MAHVLGTFYDKTGKLIWVSDGTWSARCLPQTPVPFAIPIPQDIAGKIKTERAVTTTYSSGGLQ